MNLTELKNENGYLSGIVIPVADFSELKETIKSGTPLHAYLSDLISSAEIQSPYQHILPNGSTIAEDDQRAALLTDELYKNAFKKGIPMFYRDERAKGPKEFIRANPDGSEDLVSYKLENRSYSLLKNLLPPGKGHFSYLSPSNFADETKVLHSRRSEWGR